MSCDDKINIKLKDNGKGFDINIVAKGFRNMEERVVELGNTLAIDSKMVQKSLFPYHFG